MRNALIVLVLLVALVLGPIATIASLNTLFSLGIPYNIYTWLSVFWIGLVIAGHSRSSK